MSYEIEVLEQPVQPSLAVRRRAAVQDLPQVLGQAFGDIMAHVGKLGEKVPGPAYVAYFNMDMADLDMEVGMLTGKALDGGDTVAASGIPAGRYVTAQHKGPYAAICSLYEALVKYTQDHGLTPQGTSYELYYNSPMEVPESELLTRVLMAVK